MLVDARGKQCPMPVIETKKAMEGVGQGEKIEVLVDNEIAVQNVSKLGKDKGAEVEVIQKSEKEYCIQISLPQNEEGVARLEKKEKIAVISSDRMGAGNDELGKVLLKGFIFALSQLETLPSKILFYNGGATLTAEGSDSLEDLKKMEAEGVEILTCGTCLDYYGLKEKLGVGSVTNMYAIVEAMEQAEGILRP